MAEESTSGGEKTEAPSGKRREDFRKKGQVAQSKEVQTASLFTITLLFLDFLPPHLLERPDRNYFFNLAIKWWIRSYTFLDYNPLCLPVTKTRLADCTSFSACINHRFFLQFLSIRLVIDCKTSAP